MIYFAAIAGVIHYWWLVKADIHKPLEYAAVLSVLLWYRVVSWAIPKLTPRVTHARFEVPGT